MFFLLHSYSIQIDNMATLTSESTCFSCHKTREIYICKACSKQFCFDCLSKHRTNIQEQFDLLQNDHDQIRQQINELKVNSTKHSSIEIIDQWEQESINKIKQNADLCRSQWMNYLTRYFSRMEQRLNHLAEQIKQVQRENQFNETDLNSFKQRLTKLEEELNQPTSVAIKQQSTAFINKISLRFPSGKTQCTLF